MKVVVIELLVFFFIWIFFCFGCVLLIGGDSFLICLLFKGMCDVFFYYIFSLVLMNDVVYFFCM